MQCRSGGAVLIPIDQSRPATVVGSQNTSSNSNAGSSNNKQVRQRATAAAGDSSDMSSSSSDGERSYPGHELRTARATTPSWRIVAETESMTGSNSLMT